MRPRFVAQLLLLSILLVGANVSATPTAMAGAVEAYGRREGSTRNIKIARKMFEDILKHGRSNADKIEAAEYLGRLAYYEGDLLTKSRNSRKRKKIFGQCRDYMDEISPEKMGHNPQYYYWKTLCVAFWAKSAGTLSAIGVLGELKDLMAKGVEYASRYEGGGIYRVRAGIFIRSKMMFILGLYKPQKALEEINQAISLGPDFYNAYLIKAEVLKALGRSDDALELLEDFKGELEDRLQTGSMPQHLVPENKVILGRMVDLMVELR